MDKIKILVVPSDRTGVSAFRSTKPHVFLEKKYPNNVKIDIEYSPRYENDEWLKQYDIIHFHRTFAPYEKMNEVMKRLKRLNIITVMDIDDYWEPGPHHPAYLLVKKNKLPEKIVKNLELADYVTTTTEKFKSIIEKINKNVEVIPNGVDPTEKQYTPNPIKSDRLRIGYLGGSSHLKDLELLNGLVSKLKTDGLMDKIQMVLCGFDLRGNITTIDSNTGEEKTRKITPKESVWYKYEQIFTDNYSIVSPEYKEFLLSFKKGEYPNIENEPYRRVWTKHINSYATNYNLFDISLAPLAKNIFNQSKSELKVVEAGFHKKALIAQDIEPYQINTINAVEKGGEINPKGNVLLVDPNKNHKQWYQHIKRLIKNPDLIELLSNNLYNMVNDKYSLGEITEKRYHFYNKIIK